MSDTTAPKFRKTTLISWIIGCRAKYSIFISSAAAPVLDLLDCFYYEFASLVTTTLGLLKSSTTSESSNPSSSSYDYSYIESFAELDSEVS